MRFPGRKRILLHALFLYRIALSDRVFTRRPAMPFTLLPGRLLLRLALHLAGDQFPTLSRTAAELSDVTI